jgi:hypothetical protein
MTDYAALLAAIERRSGRLPELERTTFGTPTRAQIVGREPNGDDLPCEVFPAPIQATYCGSLTELTGRRVEVLGRCDCDDCIRTVRVRYIARVPETAHLIAHSRAQSFQLSSPDNQPAQPSQPTTEGP